MKNPNKQTWLLVIFLIVLYIHCDNNTNNIIRPVVNLRPEDILPNEKHGKIISTDRFGYSEKKPLSYLSFSV